MFSSNFTWAAEARVEKVGERRARKQPSIGSGLGTPSDSATISSRSSSVGRQSSFASFSDSSMQTILQFNKKSMPDQDHGIDVFRDEGHNTRKMSLSTVRDANLTDTITYRRTGSDSTLFSKKWPGRTVRKVKTPLLSGFNHSPNTNQPECKMLDELHQVQDLASGSSVSRSVTRMVEVLPAQRCVNGRAVYGDTKPLRRTEIVATPKTSIPAPESPKTSVEQDPAWRPPSCWNVKPTQNAGFTFENSISEHTLNSTARSGDITHLRKFIDRMEQTKPDIIAERLKDGYEVNGDAISVEASQLKYQLWLLAALQRGRKGRPGTSSSTSSPSKSSRFSRFSSISSSSTVTAEMPEQGHIMVLFGSLADVYQIGIVHADKQVTASSTFPSPQLALPPNVNYQRMSSPTYLPLPYPSSIFTHVYSPALAPSLSAPKISSILLEMHRLLCEDGTIEIRLTDVVPKRAGLKLRMWLDDHVMVNLERGFRCARPALLMPDWLVDAGFVLQASSTLTPSDGISLPTTSSSILPASPALHSHPLPSISPSSFSPSIPPSRAAHLPAVPSRTSSSFTSYVMAQTTNSSPAGYGSDRSSSISNTSSYSSNSSTSSTSIATSRCNDEYEKLSVIAGQALWKDVWGGFVQKQRCDWWDDPEIERECREMGTTIEVQTIYAIKKSKEGDIVRSSGLGQ